MHGSALVQDSNKISGVLWRIGRISDLRCFASPNQIDKHQQHSNRNAGVGNIECRPMITSIEKIEKIDHLLVQNPVDQVPNSSAENQNQRNSNHFIFPGRLMKKYQNSNNGNDRKPDEQPGLVLGWPIRKQTECNSGIANMGDREKIINHHYKMMLRDMGIDPHLGVLIENDQNDGSQE